MNRHGNIRLAPEVNRIVYVKNLPFSISTEEIYELFGKYGAIRQVRLGTTNKTKGRAYVVYEDIYDAKNAVDHLSGFNVRDRYIICLYHRPERLAQDPNVDLQKKEAKLERMKQKFGVDDTD